MGAVAIFPNIFGIDMTYSGIKLSRSCQNLMIAHAQQTFPEECCGTLLGRDLDSGVREVLQIIRVENTKD